MEFLHSVPSVVQNLKTISFNLTPSQLQKAVTVQVKKKSSGEQKIHRDVPSCLKQINAAFSSSLLNSLPSD